MAENKSFIDFNKLSEIAEEDKKNLTKSKNTQIAYKSDWEDFKDFCNKYKVSSIPADYETVRNYLVYLSKGIKQDYKLNTIKRRIASIAHFHTENNVPFDTRHSIIKNQMNVIKRSLKGKLEQTSPLLFEDLKKIIDVIDEEILKNPSRLINYRDKCIILIGWFGAFRRSELVNLKIENIEINNQGLSIKMDKSKTDQEGKLEAKGIEKSDSPNSPYCPVNSYAKWLHLSSIRNGLIFRQIDTSNRIFHEDLSDKSISLIIKNWARKSLISDNKLSGHSFRAGYATELAKAGASETEIMKTTQHKSADMVRRYIRDAETMRTAAKKYLKF